MKKYFVLTLLGVSVIGYGQNKPVKIVFDVTSKDTLTHQAVLRHVNDHGIVVSQFQF